VVSGCISLRRRTADAKIAVYDRGGCRFHRACRRSLRCVPRGHHTHPAVTRVEVVPGRLLHAPAHPEPSIRGHKGRFRRRRDPKRHARAEEPLERSRRSAPCSSSVGPVAAGCVLSRPASSAVFCGSLPAYPKQTHSSQARLNRMPVDQRHPPRACAGQVIFAAGEPNRLTTSLTRALTEERDPLRLIPARQPAQQLVHPTLQLRRCLDRCNRLDHRSRRMVTPRIRARRSRCEQTPLETPTHRAERRERPCDMNAIAAIHTDNVAASRNPMPVDAHAEQPGTRPLTPHQRQLPHLSSQG